MLNNSYNRICVFEARSVEIILYLMADSPSADAAAAEDLVARRVAGGELRRRDRRPAELARA